MRCKNMNPNAMFFFRVISMLVIGLWGLTAQALSIDSMVIISGQHGSSDSYVLTNNSTEPLFMRTEVSRIDIKNNDEKEIPFTRDNLAEWTITLDPALFILDPGESRKVSLRPLTEKAHRNHDEVYSVSFIPKAYKQTEKDKDSMNLQVGFRAFYIVPAGKSNMDYDLNYDRKSGKLTIDNKGNTVVLAVLDQCRNGVRDDVNKPCSMTFMAVAGKTKVFDVPQWLRLKKMAFEVQNHDKTYRKSVEQ